MPNNHWHSYNKVSPNEKHQFSKVWQIWTCFTESFEPQISEERDKC